MRPHQLRRASRLLTTPALGLLAIVSMVATPASASASSAVTIGTVGAPGYHEGGYEFGGGNSVASIGQVVTVPAGVTTLESFSLSPQSPPSFVFRAYVYAWGEGHTQGPALYESGDMHAPSLSAYQPLTLQTGGVPVTPGQQYVLFLSRSNEQAADEGSTEGYALQIVRSERMFEPPPYQEGGLVTLSNGYTPSEWGTHSWSEFSSFADAEFEATFDTPAPVITTPQVPGTGSTTVSTTTLTSTKVAPPAPHCVVPDLDGLTLAALKSALSAADCTLGKIQHHWFSTAVGELMEQNAHHGTVLPAGSKVSVWLSRGPHPHKHKHAR